VLVILFVPYGVHHSELARVAISLARHGTFSDPYIVPTGPTAHVAPGYTLILALIYKTFGYQATGLLVARVLSAIVSSVQFAILPFVAVACGLEVSVGVLAGMLGVIPMFAWIETSGQWEAIWTSVIFAIAVSLLLDRWRKQDASLRAGMLTGLVWAIGLVFSPALLPTMLTLLGVGSLIALRGHDSRRVKFNAYVLLSCTAALTPVLAWNYHRLGAFVFVRSNFGLELYLSNNPKATARYKENVVNGDDDQHPFFSQTEAARVQQLGEPAYNREKVRAAFEWIRENPGRFAALTIERSVLFWFPRTSFPAKTVAAGALSLVSAIGLILLFRTLPLSASVLAAAMVSYSILYWLIQADARYSYPIRWIQLIAASYAMLYFVRRSPIGKLTRIHQPTRAVS
jgi:hypothetical protein